MVAITVPWTYFANGNIQGNPGDAGNPLRVDPTGLPFNQSFTGPGGPIAFSDNATIRLTFLDSSVVQNDADVDGVVEFTIVTNTRIQLFEVDLDGDGIYESQVTGQNPNDLDIQLGNQTGSNVARLNGNLRISVDGGPPQQFTTANLYISNDLPFGTLAGPGADVPIQNSGKNFIIGDPNDPIFGICFARGTLIATPDGEVPVEDLEAGDRVLTADGRAAILRWTGWRRFSGAALVLKPNLKPVRFETGALGKGLPRRPLTVSPKHRILLRDWRAELLFGAADVLVPAESLVNGSTIRQLLTETSVDYFHLLCDEHEVLLAEGVPSESFHPGRTGLGTLAEATRAEILTIFPELAADPESYGATAHPALRGWEAETLLRFGGTGPA